MSCSQQLVGTAVGTKCAPLLTDLFLHYYVAAFIAYRIKYKEHRLAG